jgi:F0F1-type ATP synthase assembly protein I
MVLSFDNGKCSEKRLEDAQSAMTRLNFTFASRTRKNTLCISREHDETLMTCTNKFCEAQEGISGVLIGVSVGVACLAGLALLALLIFLGVLVDLSWVHSPTLGSLASMGQ